MNVQGQATVLLHMKASQLPIINDARCITRACDVCRVWLVAARGRSYRRYSPETSGCRTPATLLDQTILAVAALACMN